MATSNTSNSDIPARFEATVIQTNEVETIIISVKNIPDWLHNSEWYETLNTNLDKEITINSEYFKYTCDINNTAELLLVLHIMVFWGLKYIPESVFDFILNNRDNIDLQYIKTTSNIPNINDIWSKLYLLLCINEDN